MRNSRRCSDRNRSALRRFAQLASGDDATAKDALERTLAQCSSKPFRREDHGGVPASLTAYRLLFAELATLMRVREACGERRPCNCAVETPEGPGAAAIVKRRFYALPFGHRAAFTLVVIERFSLAEAATIMGTDEKTIRDLVSSARRRVARQTLGAV